MSTRKTTEAEQIAALPPAEQADWFDEHLDEVVAATDSAATPTTLGSLDRVVSVRLSPEDLGALKKAADDSGLKLSAWLRKVALEAAATQEAPAAVLSAADARQLTHNLSSAMGEVAIAVELLERHGLTLEPPKTGRSLIVSSGSSRRRRKPKQKT